eukprot:CAMPEP_0201514476 /NCGR_PEP_ID=MMETSP0161_2-20130828/6311_1 /ASSEMBLY_ACC=CAM_ASM_000251 /TAXON_ID=180227 /ORGANISM="Neoparamoeba aestuarina, Strain SoJaBio B1-5/56/2" /LENGTH=296 /DNA_ID=CAMNT_0047911039 /DNA_START=42 /DNA_END=932 /DNA_ORIENTATION=-
MIRTFSLLTRRRDLIPCATSSLFPSPSPSQTRGIFTNFLSSSSFSSPLSPATHSPKRLVHLSTDKDLELYCGGLVERIPRLIPVPPEWKQEKKEFQDRVAAQKLQAKKLKPIKGFMEVIDDLFAENGVYTRSRVTKADKEKNYKSLHRKMDRRLYFVVKVKRDSSIALPSATKTKTNSKNKKSTKPTKEEGYQWTFPSVRWESGEKLRETCERAHQSLTPKFDLYFLSNAPDAHVVHREGKGEGKVKKFFYYRGYHLEGAPDLAGDAVEYAWLTKEELGEVVDEEVFEGVKNTLRD